ncbi:hypothetical protein ACFYW6_40380 [Streptomyces sp. NPDC002659]|uniref:hypothetical protein n=1 Tax=Streptomyces sp. NPDC002659 TaxID=3364656 RepID=UPI0036B4DB8E
MRRPSAAGPKPAEILPAPKTRGTECGTPLTVPGRHTPDAARHTRPASPATPPPPPPPPTPIRRDGRRRRVHGHIS